MIGAPRWPQLPNKLRKLKSIRRKLQEYETYVAEVGCEYCVVVEAADSIIGLVRTRKELNKLIKRLEKKPSGSPTYIERT